jgi:hypothetical protein
MFDIYNFFITAKLRTLNLFGCLEIAKKYDKIYYDPKEIFDKNGYLIDKEAVKHEPVFISTKDSYGCESCAVFYDNLFILFSMNEEQGDKAVQIYVKRPDDEWQISVNESNSNLDPTNPANIKAEVYVNYDVSVFKLNRRLGCCVGENYTPGKWNKMFYKSLNSFLGKVEGYTELNQVSKAYGK